MFGAQLFNGTSADSGATVGFNPDYILNPARDVALPSLFNGQWVVGQE